MTIISSQRFRNPEIIQDKIEKLIESKAKYVEIPVINAHYKDLEDNDLYIIIDKHHTLCAAFELGLEIRYVEAEDPFGDSKNGEKILANNRIDNNYYYIDTDYDDLIGGDVW